MTHKVTIEGEWVNDWAVSEDRACGPVGAGKLSVKFRTGATRVRPYVDRDAGRR